MSRLPGIPDFTDDIPSMSATLRALKGAVEILGGLRQGSSLGAPQVFVQENMPEPSRLTSFAKGDFWIKSITPAEFYFWNDQQWIQVP